MTIYYIDQNATAALDCNKAIEEIDDTLGESKTPSLKTEIPTTAKDIASLFLSRYDLDYICNYPYSSSSGMRIVTHPCESNTCFEKASLLGSWDPLNVIKVFYLEHSKNGLLYAIVVPETGCFIDRARIRKLLELPDHTFLKKAESLPDNMSFGTCSPFVLAKDLTDNGGRVAKILFDTNTLKIKREEKTLDDFSFGMDHRMSIQMNYYDCYSMLKSQYLDTISDADILNLSFKEKLVRNKGKIKISYEFNTLNYRTAKFINDIHGFGDVTILNDYVDEMNLPDVIKE